MCVYTRNPSSTASGSATIKGWSHDGATRSLGDVGNQCMHMALHLVHSVRARSSESELWEFTSRNQEHAADQLEAIMALRDLDPRWRRAGDVVDTVCCAVYHAWKSLRYSCHHIVLGQQLQLELVVSRRCKCQEAQAQMRRRCFGHHVYAALYRKNLSCSVLQIIVRLVVA